MLQEEGDLLLEGSRHPCVEAQEDVSFIPNDCCLVGHVYTLLLWVDR